MSTGNRYTADEIVAAMHRIDKLTAAGDTIAQAATKVGVSRASVNKWRHAYREMTVDAVREVREEQKIAGIAAQRETQIGRVFREPYRPRMSLAERREQVLDAALGVIVTQGVHRVSVGTVATHAGLTRTLVRRVFDNSEDLLRASLDREQTAALAQLTTALRFGRDERSQPQQAVAAGLDRLLAAAADAPDRWRAVIQLTNSAAPEVQEQFEGSFVDVVDAFVHAIGASTRRAADVGLTTRMVVALLWEAMRCVLTDPGRWPPEQVRDYTVAAITALPGFAATRNSR